jgi:hypothetical protein
MTQPDLAPGTDVVADPAALDDVDATLTTDPEERTDDLDPNRGEEGSG